MVVKGKQPQSVRVIAGRFRGRRISFPAIPHLRPTSDRVRETLFNWLQKEVVGAICLDLCAGSGALSFEALSRGAESVILVEGDPKAVEALQKNSVKLGAPLQVIPQDVLSFLEKTPSFPVDILFMDPPFGSGFCVQIFSTLYHYGWLSSVGSVYVECARKEEAVVHAALPRGWYVHRQMKTDKVVAFLLKQEISVSEDF